MIINLSKRKVIVTASTSGIGLAIVAGMLRAGAAVVINGRNAENTHRVAEQLCSQITGADVMSVVADLATSAGVNSFIEQVPQADILVNNLGIYEEKTFTAITDQDWQRYFETNVMSGIRLSRHYFPQMLQQNRGRVIFVSSESAITIPPTRIHYAMTKTAQLTVSWSRLALMARSPDGLEDRVIEGPSVVESGWSIVVGTRVTSRAFALGERVAFSLDDLIGMIWSHVHFVNTIAQSVQRYAESLGFVFNASEPAV